MDTLNHQQNEEPDIELTEVPVQMQTRGERARRKTGKMTLKNQRLWVEWVFTRDSNVELALTRIYERQTLSEQRSHTTREDNNRGFGAFDAEFGTSMAKGLIKYGHLSPKQVGFARKMMMRYWRQLVECARARGRLPETMPEACVLWVEKHKVEAQP